MSENVLYEYAKAKLKEELLQAQKAGYRLMIMQGGRSYGIPPEKLLLLLERDPNNQIVRQLLDAKVKELKRALGV